MEFKPNLFIVGAAKCGTTSLHNYLSQVSEICMSKPKEPFFFECEYKEGLKYYQSKYFAHWKGEKIIGEARHRNLYLPYVAERIYNTNSDAYIVVIVRNPAERAFAHWWHWYYRGREKDSFEDAINKNLQRLATSDFNENQVEDIYCKILNSQGGSRITSYVDSGYYYPQIKNYLNFFPKERILVIQNEDFKKKRQEVLKRALRFVGLDEKLVSQINLEEVHNKKNKNKKFPPWVYKVLGPTGILKWKWVNSTGKKLRSKLYSEYDVSDEIMDALREHYKPYNRELEKMLGIDLSGWDNKKVASRN